MPDGLVTSPGAAIYPRLEWSVSLLVGTLGVRIIRDSDGVEVLARQTTGIAETPATSGQYVATLTAPTTAGEYTIFWDDGAVTPGHSATEDLRVTSSAPSVAAGDDWCSLDDVKAYLQKTDTTFDDLLADMIPDATEGLEALTGRELSDKGTLTRRVAIDCDAVLVDLRPWDLRHVDSITVDPLGTARVLTTSQYQLHPVSKTTVDTYIQLLLGLSVSAYSSRSAEFGTTEIDITGQWGTAATPRRAKRACIVTVGQWFRREVAARGSGRDDYDDAGYLTPLSIPGSAIRLLSSLTRTRLV